MDAKVPSLLLQPLVENSIRHGIVPRSGPGQIVIRAERLGDDLQVQVIDNGPGVLLSAQESFKEGIGLSNTRARLQGLYGDGQSFKLSNSPGGGLVVTVTMPFRDDNPTPAEDEPADRHETPTPARTA
jgi:sensor histidine kinase YesM